MRPHSPASPLVSQDKRLVRPGGEAAKWTSRNKNEDLERATYLDDSINPKANNPCVGKIPLLSSRYVKGGERRTSPPFTFVDIYPQACYPFPINANLWLQAEYLSNY